MAMTVFCDQKTNGGGWVVFQRRVNGSVNFERGWWPYKVGHGHLSGEFWLGNDNIHRMTIQNVQLLIELKDFDDQSAHACYGSFYVGTDAEKFALNIGEFSGTAGDSMSVHNGMKFSATDRYGADNDLFYLSCARRFRGPWWYNACHTSHLNGRYGDNACGKGINWMTWKGYQYSLKESSMKVKPKQGKVIMESSHVEAISCFDVEMQSLPFIFMWPTAVFFDWVPKICLVFFDLFHTLWLVKKKFKWIKG